MTQAAAIADDLGSRPRRREARDVSHRFRRGPRVWTRAPLLVLLVAVPGLLVFALRSEPPRSQPRAPVTTLPPAPPVSPAPATTPAAGPAATFQVQVGSFLEPRNAARLVGQLRAEGLLVESLIAEGRHGRYRVIALREDGADADELVARLRDLGFSSKPASGAVAVTGFVPTSEADDAAGRLEDAGIAVRVEEERGAVSYHVVRVGAYPTAEAAERGRDELAARGLPGLVVRVQPEDGSIDP
jgi:cell division protein FtsN